MASSLGKSFHCTKYSFIVLLLNLLSLVFNILSRVRISYPSSSKVGIASETEICWPITFFRHETHYEFYFLLEAPIHRPLLQFFESLCRDRKALVWDFLNLYPLWWFVCRDATWNTHIVGLHIGFSYFGKPTSYLSKPSKFIEFIQSNP